VYDKINDLSKPKKRATDKDQTKQQFSIFDYIQGNNNRLEVLRLEIRLSKKRKMNEILKQLEYKKEITVDEIRKINEFMHKTSSDGNYRVVIVDGADKMNRNSQNAILKILEEPPKKTIIILTANNIGAFLPTIKSRCRVLKLSPLSEDNISKLLNRFCEKITEEKIKKISLLSEGSIGKAMQIYNQDGLEVYEDLIALLSKNINSKELHKLCEEYGITLKYCGIDKNLIPHGEDDSPDKWDK
jgi:hypothetical protein